MPDVCTAIPLTLTMPSGSIRLGCLGITVEYTYDTRIVRAAPRDWYQYLWKSGVLTLDGLVRTRSTDTALFAPNFVTNIQIRSGQKVYECRRVACSLSPSSAVNVNEALIGGSVSYQFLRYDSSTLNKQFTTTPTFTKTTSEDYLTSLRSFTTLTSASGVFKSFNLSNIAFHDGYKIYDHRTFPTVLPLYTEGALVLEGRTTNPNFWIGLEQFPWLRLQTKNPTNISSNIIDVTFRNCILQSEAIAVERLNERQWIYSTKMVFKTSPWDSITGSNQGSWYYKK